MVQGEDARLSARRPAPVPGRDRVHAAVVPGMAPADAPRGEPGALHRAVHVHGLQPVGGAAGEEPAHGSVQRGDHGPVDREQSGQQGGRQRAQRPPLTGGLEHDEG
ncbi:Uncharacterised protein [Streptococcus pneumoniae]|nr:Uncharacterised protein [Streptococcus pneumoniae]